MSLKDAPATDPSLGSTHRPALPMLTEGWMALAFEERSSGTVRQLLDVLLRARGVSRGDAQNVVLVAHEVFVNALDHGRPDETGRVEFRWDLSDDEAVMSVCDAGGDALIEVGPNSLDAPRGRGMAIVAGLSTAWSVDTSRGTRVTVRVPLTSGG